MLLFKSIYKPFRMMLSRNPRSVLRKLIRILHEDLEYSLQELIVDYKKNRVTVKRLIILEYNIKRNTIDISYSANTYALGASMVVNALHNGGFSHLRFKENFFVDPVQGKVTYGKEAQRVWETTLRNVVVDKIREQVKPKVIPGGNTIH